MKITKEKRQIGDIIIIKEDFIGKRRVLKTDKRSGNSRLDNRRSRF